MKIGDFGMSRHELDRAPVEGLRTSLEKTLTAGETLKLIQHNEWPTAQHPP